MSSAMHSAATLAFLGDVIDIEALERMVQARGLRLESSKGFQAVAHLNGDPDALVAELIRLAKIGVAMGVEASSHPERAIGSVFGAVEARLRRL